MAKAAAKKAGKGRKPSKSRKQAKPDRARILRTARTWLLRAVLGLAGLLAALVLLFSVVNPPITHTIWSESRRLGGVERDWVPVEEMPPVLLRAVVAAEDARFCQHWGFDVKAIRAAIAGGGRRGGSTISQQVVKNVFLWQGRSWPRKALETVLTPAVEAVWSKRRILEVYLNVAEMGEGVFGAEAAAQHYFGTKAASLGPRQAAQLAAVLPDPKSRSAANPTRYLQRRAAQIIDGAATIRADGRAACFED